MAAKALAFKFCAFLSYFLWRRIFTSLAILEKSRERQQLLRLVFWLLFDKEK